MRTEREKEGKKEGMIYLPNSLARQQQILKLIFVVEESLDPIIAIVAITLPTVFQMSMRRAIENKVAYGFPLAPLSVNLVLKKLIPLDENKSKANIEKHVVVTNNVSIIDRNCKSERRKKIGSLKLFFFG